MKRMLLAAALTLAASLSGATALSVPSGAAGAPEPLWDSFTEVPMAANGPQQWFICPHGQVVRLEKSGSGAFECVEQGFVSDTVRGKPRSVSLQAALEHFVGPVPGSIEAVGPIPSMLPGATANQMSPTSVVIAFKLRKLP